MPFRSIPWKRNQLGTKRGSRIDDFWCSDKSFCEVILLLFRKAFPSLRVYFTMFVHSSPHIPLYKYQVGLLFHKTNFFLRNSIPVPYVQSFGIGSSAELGMPRNECFLPRNNEILFPTIVLGGEATHDPQFLNGLQEN